MALWWKRRILKLEGIGETEQWRIMPVARPQMSDSRVIAHVDMDCFYVQGSSISHFARFSQLQKFDNFSFNLLVFKLYDEKALFFLPRKSKLNFIYLQKSTYFNFLLNFWLIALNFVFTGVKLLENFGQRICLFWNRFEKLEDSIWSRCSVSDIFENIPRDVYSCVSICFCWGHRSIIVWTNWFWCQFVVEQRKQPNLRGHPTAVVQYNSWKGGGLIAVSYEARKFGVKRWVYDGFFWTFSRHCVYRSFIMCTSCCVSSMRGDEAKEICPLIQLVQVPVARGKADLNVYRDAGSEVRWVLLFSMFLVAALHWKLLLKYFQVVSILSRKGRCERASIDEVYLDITEAAETMLAETPPENLHLISEEATKSHVLGLKMVRKFSFLKYVFYYFLLSVSILFYYW